MLHTFEHMNAKELVYYYELYLNHLENYLPDSSDYNITMNKINAIEELLRKKKPNYFKEKKEIYESIKDDNYTIKEACSILDITRQTLYNWIKIGMIKSIKIGRTPYISKKEMDYIFKNGAR